MTRVGSQVTIQVFHHAAFLPQKPPNSTEKGRMAHVFVACREQVLAARQPPGAGSREGRR